MTSKTTGCCPGEPGPSPRSNPNLSQPSFLLVKRHHLVKLSYMSNSEPCELDKLMKENIPRYT